jgi:hypothetical protein
MEMGELLLGLLWCVLEPVLEAVFEAIFEYVGTALWDLLSRALSVVFGNVEIQDPALAVVGYALCGLMVGGLSLLLFPHHLMQSSRFHGVSLLISPAIAGLMMARTGAFLRNRDKRVTQLESFGYGSVFAFGIALVRLIFAR